MEIEEYCNNTDAKVPSCEPIECGPLQVPPNVTVSQTTTTYGSKAIVSCPAGYHLYGSNTSTCDSNGKWTSTGQNCTIVDCGPLHMLLNGTVSHTTTTYGSKAIVSCPAGYHLYGSNTSTCDSNGKWTSTGQNCTIVDCGPAHAPTNGNVKQTTTTYGSKSTVSCQTGYNLHGNNTSTCESNGKWSTIGPNCTIVDCGILRVPPNVTASQITTTYGSKATVSCLTGYTLHGSNIYTCESNGKWASNGQNCTIVDCGPLQVPRNGTVSQTTTTYGSKVTVSCQTGYNLHGNNSSTCESNGKWSTVGHNCTIVDCGILQVPPNVTASQTTTTYGSKATVSCLTGYTLHGSNIYTCESNGKWASTGQNCTIVDCGPSQVPRNGTVSQTTTTYGSKVTLSCHTGYNLHGNNTSTCESNGKWSTIGHNCTIVDCGILRVSPNVTASQPTTTYGSKATVSCLTGYILHGSNIYTCESNGKWTSTGQNCTIVDCGSVHVHSNVTVSQTTTTYGSKAIVSCPAGYHLYGSNISTCDSNGTWTNTGQNCTIVDCGPLNAPLNGTVSHTTTTYGSMAMLSCQTGYNLYGSNTSICDSNGNWNSTGQNCSIVDIGLDQAIRAGCSSIGWDISVDLSILQQMYPSISSNNIYFGETSCRGSFNRNVLQYTFGFQDCLTNEKISGEAIIYENKLVYATLDPLNPHIIRNHVWTYAIECDVIRREATSSHIHHDVNTHHSSVVVHNNISLGFYSDPSFSREIHSNPLHASVGGTIYVKVYTTVSDWSLKMRLHSCYTKPWQTSNSTLDYMLISDGCEVDSNTHIMSQSTHETTFMFKDFEYSGNPEGLDVYCNATFCQASDFTPICLQACNLQP